MINNKYANLYLLITGQFISQLGDKFYTLALAFWVLQSTGSPSEMGLVLFFTIAPGVLLGFFSGGIVDRFNRKAILIASDVFRGLVIGLIVLAYFTGLLNLFVIISAQVLLSMASALFNPTVQAIIPQIVDREDLVSANAKSQLISGISLVAGPVFGGLVVSYLGYSFVFIFNALSFMAAATFEAFMNITAAPGINELNTTMKNNIKEGYNYIFGKRKILIIIFIVAGIHFFVGSIQVIIPVFANMLNGNGARNLGYIETFFGLGAMAAALLLNVLNFNCKEEKSMFGGIAVLGLIFIVYATLAAGRLQFKIPFFIIFLLMSSTIVIIGTSYQIILQKEVENIMAGRVFSIVGSIGNIMLPAATLVFGFLMDRFQIYLLSGICGVVLVFTSILLFKIYGRISDYAVKGSNYIDTAEYQ